MLNLSRRAGESIQIGDNIIVRVVSIKGSVVKIGIEAPRHIAIVRDDAKYDRDGKRIDPDGNR